MKYIITEGKFDSYIIYNLFKDEIQNTSWMVVPIEGGISEAVSLAESLAYRHKDGSILLIVDSGDDIDDNNDNVYRIKSRLDKYNNIKIVFSSPNIENEIIDIIGYENMPKYVFGLGIKPMKDKFISYIKDILPKGNYKINETPFYKNIKNILCT